MRTTALGRKRSFEVSDWSCRRPDTVIVAQLRAQSGHFAQRQRRKRGEPMLADIVAARSLWQAGREPDFALLRSFGKLVGKQLFFERICAMRN